MLMLMFAGIFESDGVEPEPLTARFTMYVSHEESTVEISQEDNVYEGTY